MKNKEEIPIKSFSIAAYICRVVDGVCKHLIIKRNNPYHSYTWQMVSGVLEKAETATQAALREIKEETGLIPDRFYSADDVEIFYEFRKDRMILVPVFVGFIDKEQKVILSEEHVEYKWVTADEADDYLIFNHQKQMLRKIEEQFVNKKPNEFLKIDIDQNN
jgi:dATP pyrophosphohydrolase